MRKFRETGVELLPRIEAVIERASQLPEGSWRSVKSNLLADVYPALLRVAENVGFPVREYDSLSRWNEVVYGTYKSEPWNNHEIALNAFDGTRSVDSKVGTVIHELAHHFALTARGGDWIDYRGLEDELLAELVVWVLLREKLPNMDNYLGHYLSRDKADSLYLLPRIWPQVLDTADRLSYAIENPEDARHAERRDF